jgi:hypothetical protein
LTGARGPSPLKIWLPDPEHADQEVATDRIVDDARDGLVPLNDSHHDAEERHAGREVESAVDRIDDEGKLGPRKFCEQHWVDLTGLLADDQRAGIARG